MRQIRIRSVVSNVFAAPFTSPVKFSPPLIACIMFVNWHLLSALSAVILSISAFAQLPNPKLTPGAVRTTNAKEICAASFTTRDERHTTAAMKKQVCQAYGIKNCPKAKVMELDHLVSLELGGADDVKNLWPQMALPKPGFHEKDKLENALHREVCAGHMTLPEAQKCISVNWIQCYRERLPSRP